MKEEHKLTKEWSLWLRSHEEKSWDINTYKKVYTMNTIEEYWALHNNIRRVQDMMFLMKEDIVPVFEDEKNKNGGQITIVTSLKEMLNVYHDLSSLILTNNLCNQMENINGVSLSTRGSKALLKIWFNDYENFREDLLNKKIKINYKNKYFDNFRIKKNI